MPVDSLRQYPGNPRNSDPEIIAESLAINGQYRPLIVAQDGTIIAGNHTYQAALSLRWDEVEVVRLPYTWDSTEARRILLADNRTSDLGADKYDLDTLLGLLSMDEDLAGTGYDTDAVDQLTRLMGTLGGSVDADDEWDGMPSYESEDMMGAAKVTITFPTEQDAEDFFALIQREKRSSMWWPSDPDEDGPVRHTRKERVITDA